jgi:hypothetical protein
MEQQERDLVRRYLDGYRLYAEINGRPYEVLYAARLGIDDPLPWIAVKDPALRFPNSQIRVHAVVCIVCGTEVGPGIKARRDFPVMDLCEDHAVAELAGDLVQIEKGTMK